MKKDTGIAFILDHGKEADGIMVHKDSETTYGYNKRKFDKLYVGADVLFRHPGKMTRDRKFEIYGGGVVAAISEPDSSGNVIATISDQFRIIPALRQGDDFVENFVWKSKTKKQGSWEHFWNQYGMNTISRTDYTNLLDKANCVAYDDGDVVKEKDINDDDIDILKKSDSLGFNVVFVDEGRKSAKSEKSYSGVARKLDYDKIQKSKSKIGAIGEAIVFELLSKEAAENSYRIPVHVSEDEGDGLGYDIRSFNKSGNEVHVEVKTTTSDYVDGFEMTYNELNASRDKKYEYKIYRVFSLDVKTRECKIKVIEGAINKKDYNLVSTRVAVYFK